jgi:hypothetical protein
MWEPETTKISLNNNTFISKNKLELLCNDVGEYHKDNLEWKNPVTNKNIPHDSAYVTLKKKKENRQKYAIRARDTYVGVKVQEKPPP